MATVNFVSPNLMRVRDTVMRFAIAARDGAGALDTGLACTCAVQRTSDSKWWNVAGGTWDVALVANPMTEVSAVDLPGLYELVLNYTTLFPAGVNAEYTLRLIGSDGVVTAQDVQVVRVNHWLDSHIINDDAVTNPLADLGELLRVLRAFFGNDQMLDDADKKLILFADDGTTPLVEFDTTDAAGIASVREIFQMERVT